MQRWKKRLGLRSRLTRLERDAVARARRHVRFELLERRDLLAWASLKNPSFDATTDALDGWDTIVFKDISDISVIASGTDPTRKTVARFANSTNVVTSQLISSDFNAEAGDQLSVDISYSNAIGGGSFKATIFDNNGIEVGDLFDISTSGVTSVPGFQTETYVFQAAGTFHVVFTVEPKAVVGDTKLFIDNLNFAPTVSVKPTTIVTPESASVSVDVVVRDPDVRDTLTLTVDWQDSQPDDVIVVPPSNSLAGPNRTVYRVTHQYQIADPTKTPIQKKEVQVKVSDAHGGSSRLESVDFKSLDFNGSAFISNGFIVLTPQTLGRAGSVFDKRTLAFDDNTSFSTQFQFVIVPSIFGADGLTFVVQGSSAGSAALGAGGNGLGYSGIAPSVAVEFDTYGCDTPCIGNNNHVAILANGDTQIPVAAAAPAFALDSKNPINAWVDYDGENDLLTVYLSQDGNKPATPLVSANVDIPSILGGKANAAFLGFTAATGNGFSEHQLCSWLVDRPVQITVNADPIVSAGVDQTVNRGDSVVLTGTFTDPVGLSPYKDRWHLVSGPAGQVIPDRSGPTLSFVPTVLGDFTFTYSVTNSLNGQGTDTVVVHVINKRAVLTLNPVTTIFEGQGASLTGQFVDPDLDDGHQIVLLWDDPNNTVKSVFDLPATQNLTVDKTLVSSSGDGAGMLITGLDLATGTVTFRVEHQYKDDGKNSAIGHPSHTSTISGTVADIVGENPPPGLATNPVTTPVTVLNVQPTLSGLSLTPSGNEGDQFTLKGTILDPGTLDTLTLRIDWGDPSSPGVQVIPLPASDTGFQTFTVQHTYPDDSPTKTAQDTYTVRVWATDDDGYGALATTSTAPNLAPGGANVFKIIDNLDDAAVPVDLGTNTFAFSGQTYTGKQLFAASNGFLTLGSSTNSFSNGDLSSSPSQATIAPLWDDWQTTVNAADQVLGKLDDVNSDGTPDRLIIEWNDVRGVVVNPPVAAKGVTFQAILELNTGNRAGDIVFNYIDLASNDLHAQGAKATVGMKDAGAPAANVLLLSQNALNPLVGNGLAILVGTGSASTLTTTVRNVAPVVDAGNKFTAFVGDSVNLNGVFQDAGSLDTHTFLWHLTSASNGQVIADSTNPNMVFVPTSAGTYQFQFTATDDDGGTASDSVAVTIADRGPIVQLNPGPMIFEDQDATITGTFWQYDQSIPQTLTIDWDDPSSTTDSVFAVSPIVGLTPGKSFVSQSGDSASLVVTAIDATGHVSFRVNHRYRDDGPSGKTTPADVSNVQATIVSGVTTMNGFVSDYTADRWVLAAPIGVQAFQQPTAGAAASMRWDYAEPASIAGSGSIMQASTVATASGTVMFDWDYSGFHSDTGGLVKLEFFIKQAKTTQTTVLVHQTVAGDFDFQATAASFAVNQGDTFGFLVFGNPGVGIQMLTGLLKLTNFSAPGQGGSAIANTTLQVDNVAPTLSGLSVTPSISEMGSVTLTGNIFDPGTRDTFILSIDWGDPLQPGAIQKIPIAASSTGAQTFSYSHQYLDDMPSGTAQDNYTIRAWISDDDGYGTQSVAASAVDLVPGSAGVVTLIDQFDDTVVAVDLGKSQFNFYGQTYTGAGQLFVSSNGLITFGSGTSVFDNSDLRSSPNQPAIAPFWDDWMTSQDANDQVLAKFEDLDGDGVADRLIVEWNDVRGLETPPPQGQSGASFQTLLTLNTGTVPGDITFQYLDVKTGDSHDGGKSATIGIKDVGWPPAAPLLISQDATSSLMGNGQAIRISTGNLATATTTVQNVAPINLSATVQVANPVAPGQTPQPTTTPGNLVTLTGSAIDIAGQNDPITLTWVVTQPDGSLVNLTGSPASFTATVEGTYSAKLVATDDDLGQSSLSASFAVVSTLVEISGSDLVARDLISGGKSDNLHLRMNGTDKIEFEDPQHAIAVTVAGGDGHGTNLVRVPVSSFSGKLLVQLLGGNDQFEGEAVPRSLQVSGSDGSDALTIRSAGQPVTVDGGDGADTISIGSSASADNGNLDLITALVTVTGGPQATGGADLLYVNDRQKAAKVGYRLTPTSIVDLANNGSRPFAGVQYDGTIESVRLDGSDQANVIDVQPSLVADYYVDGNLPAPGTVAPINGDYLRLDTSGTTGRSLSITSPGSGSWSFSSGHKPVRFESIERFNHTELLAVAADAGTSSKPLVQVYDAETLALLFSFYAYETSFRGGVRVATGDVNGDGIADIVTVPGVNRAADIKVFSGAPQAGVVGQELTGLRLSASSTYGGSFRDGLNVAVGDFNGDGMADIVTTPTRGAAVVKVFQNNVLSGGGLTPARSFNAFSDQPRYIGGASVAVGDVTGDGVAEVVVGSGTGMAGQTRVFNVATAAASYAPLLTIADPNPKLRGGVFVATGDVNGDGAAEVITSTGPLGGSWVRIYRIAGGTTATLLQTFQAFADKPHNANAAVHVVVRDRDGDGTAEIWASQGPDGRGSTVRATDKTSGTPVRIFRPNNFKPAQPLDPSFVDKFFAYSNDFNGGGLYVG